MVAILGCNQQPHARYILSYLVIRQNILLKLIFLRRNAIAWNVNYIIAYKEM